MTTRSVVLLLVLTLFATGAAAQVFRWVDEQGGVHYAGSRDQVPEQYRSQLPPESPPEPAKPAPGPVPEVSRQPANIPGECILLVQGLFRARDSRSYRNCDECRKAVEVMRPAEAARASCIPAGQ